MQPIGKNTWKWVIIATGMRISFFTKAADNLLFEYIERIKPRN